MSIKYNKLLRNHFCNGRLKEARQLYENNLFTILDTTITKELKSEGIARELISKIQQMRKQKDFMMLDNITIYVNGMPEALEAIEEYREYILKETLGLHMIYTEKKFIRKD